MIKKGLVLYRGCDGCAHIASVFMRIYNTTSVSIPFFNQLVGFEATAPPCKKDEHFEELMFLFVFARHLHHELSQNGAKVGHRSSLTLNKANRPATS